MSCPICGTQFPIIRQFPEEHIGHDVTECHAWCQCCHTEWMRVYIRDCYGQPWREISFRVLKRYNKWPLHSLEVVDL